MPKVVKIERTVPPKGPPEVPFRVRSGDFKMADPGIGKQRHHAKHAIPARSLNEVADKLAHGLSLWMKQPGKRETLICAASLRVIRA
jgi:hypothetical protein